MERKFSDFFEESTKNFFEAVVNILFFLPYFFSVNALVKTLFRPWKNIASKKKIRGFSFSDWFDRFTFDLVSRGIGCMMRLSIITFFFITIVVYIFSLILIVPLYFLLTPFMFIKSQYARPESEIKNKFKTQFIANHLLKEENYQEVENWFENWYREYHFHTQWWKLSNLLSYPPLARDWAVGYTPELDDFTWDLTQPGYQQHIKHVVDRTNEINQIERALSKDDEANVLLVGEEGVGKHTIIDALAKKSYEGNIHPLLMYKRILKLDMEKILTVHTDQKQREAFMEELFSEAVQAKNVILFIDNFDRYISSGEGRIDLTTPIETFGKTAHIQIIGITTPFMYQKYIVGNDKINRIFTKIDVYEINKDQAFQIMLDTTPIFEKRFQVSIPYETLQIIIEKSDFFITSVPFPEKAMQLLDNACVYTTEVLKKSKVTPDIIDKVLTEKTHTPTTLTDDMKSKLIQLEQLLRDHIVSQPKAIAEVSSTMRRSFLLLGKRKKPLASFLFLGPTGVGKTETAKAITQVFFGTENNLQRFDMSMYQSQTDIPKLIGSLDTQNPGLLSKSIREHPYGVLLLDEIEKANHDLLNIFLTILDEGYFTDGYGKRVDCKNLVIIATSNAGADLIYKELKDSPEKTKTLSTDLVNYLVDNHIFAPEFLNRFDGVIAYNPLTENSALMIARKLMESIEEQLLNLYKVKIQVSDLTLQSIIDKDYDPAFGARDMERILRSNIEDKIAKLILENKAKEGDTIKL